MVGGEGGGSVADEAAGGLGVVDGPDVMGVAGLAEALDELLVHGSMRVGGEAVGSGGFEEGEGLVGGGGQAPALAAVGDDQVGGVLGVGFFPGGYEVGFEGDDGDLFCGEGAGGEGFFERRDHLGTVFDFDEDFLFWGNGGEDLRKGRDAGACELLVFPATDVELLEFG